MLIVAERINASRKSIYRAISEKDKNFIQNEAIIQTHAGADYIDINAGLFAEKEIDCLKWMAEIVQEATALPLCIDSADPKAIRMILPLVEKTPMINSITLEQRRFEALIPILLDRPCKIVGLCQTDGRAAHTASEKIDLTQELIGKLTQAGVSSDNIYIDPLVFPLATDAGSAKSTLEAILSIMKSFPDVHSICGLTNISFGLPERKLINRTFLTSAIIMGLDAAILDPTDGPLTAARKAAWLVSGKDPFSQIYIAAFRQGLLRA
ncbi:MAG: methyltetrahydrofolate--corrinoid methyltransferase [Desulfobacterium sp.]|nr:methyltetrahydrofolate--corrinoid methyltransferase [Desulfobacterium sp.]